MQNPSSRDLAWIAATALLARAALFAVVSWRTGATPLDYAESGDSAQYLLAARAWLHGSDLLAAFPAARRLFPGVPMLTAALLGAGLPPVWAALLPSWLAAAATAALAAWWARDARVGWATAFLPPIYLYASSVISTETLALFFSLLGIVLAARGHNLLGGMSLGWAMLCRPFALFAALGLLAGKLVERHRRDGLMVVAGIATVGAAGLLAVQLWCGDAFMSVRTYDRLHGGIVAWPFEYLVGVPFRDAVPLWKVPYVWAHALVALVAVALALRAARREVRPEERAQAVIVAVWLTGLVAFSVCIASKWAFHEFPRFMVPALPALFFALRGYLPRSPKIWGPIGAASLLLALGPAVRTVRPEVGPGSSVEPVPQRVTR